jgi:hypothetical protein
MVSLKRSCPRKEMRDCAGAEMKDEKMAAGEIVGRLSAYIARSGEAILPEAVIKKAKHHILDTLGAIL